jgi:type IV secretory pathway protease TraF
MICLMPPPRRFKRPELIDEATTYRLGGKQVVALSGDVVTVDSVGMVVDHNRIPNSHPLAVDAKGRSLAAMATDSYQVATNEVWVVSSRSARSWDSRCWGPVRVASSAGILHFLPK